MAWQNSAAMVGNGGGPGGGDGSHQNVQPQGTEYTLQGVMRFLQSEWHRHERDRNAWEIERAEMKSKIGKLEGDGRTSKRLQETLGKHVRMLEHVLKQERERTKIDRMERMPENAQRQVETSKIEAERGIDEAQATPVLKLVGSVPMQAEDSVMTDIKQDLAREKSRVYLGKCAQEVIYHVMPSTAAQQQLAEEQEQMLQNHYTNQPPSQQSLEDGYAQSHRPHTNNVEVAHRTNSNHQSHHAQRLVDLPLHSRTSQATEQASFLHRNSSDNQTSQGTGTNDSQTSRTNYAFPAINDEPVERAYHSYDVYGQQAPQREAEDASVMPPEMESVDWNFDDAPEMQKELVNAAQPDHATPLRPDTDIFPTAHDAPLKSPPRGPGSHRRKGSLSRRRQSDGSHEIRDLSVNQGSSHGKGDLAQFKLRFALRGHLDVVRSVLFTGGGSPSEPEICTTGDDGVIKRWIIPANYTFPPQPGAARDDLDISSYFTHRGHTGAVMTLAASPACQNFSNGGRVHGDGWVFSGGQDATVRVWERGRVDPKATLDGHTDAIWTICVLPGTSGSIMGEESHGVGGSDRMLLASGAADGTILIWAISSPPQLTSPHAGSRRGGGGSRRANSVSAGSNLPSSPQPSTATATPFHYTLVHRIERLDRPSPTCIAPLSPIGETFMVAYNDASILIYDTRTAEEIVGMASLETYKGTPATGVNAVVATTLGLDGTSIFDPGRGLMEDETAIHGATGSSRGVEGVVLSGHEDRYIRFFDANSGQCTYTMLAHPSAISALSLSPDGREMVSAGHDASLRFWSLETRSCTHEITSHRLMRGEGVCAVVWSRDGRYVVSGGGDGAVKVFTR